MGIRNKFCSTCTRANNTNSPIPEHQFFKNWNNSSSEMEADIILEAFQTCEQQHGIRYISFIGDGDISVYPTLISSIPWGYAITKIECANHCVKCYRTALGCAIFMKSKETNQQKAIVDLRKDLLNGPLHCFGFHSKCSIDFCKTPPRRSLPAPPNTASLHSTENTSTNNSTLPQLTTSANLPEDEGCSTQSSASQLHTTNLDDLDEAMSEQAEYWKPG